MKEYIALELGGLVLALGFPFLVMFIAWRARLGISRQILVAVFRCILQLSVLGYVLHYIFAWSTLMPILGFGLLMTVIAGWTARGRLKHRYAGMLRDMVSVFWVAAWTVVGVGLVFGVKATPWYDPQYAIPLLGMVLGNILHGISLGIERFLASLVENAEEVESMLALGATGREACRRFAGDALYAGLTPVINTMMVAGIVSIPGMMTGQILAGVEIAVAVRYQLFVIFLIVGGTGIGCLSALQLAHWRLLNRDHQLCLHRLSREA